MQPLELPNISYCEPMLGPQSIAHQPPGSLPEDVWSRTWCVAPELLWRLNTGSFQVRGDGFRVQVRVLEKTKCMLAIAWQWLLERRGSRCGQG